MSTSADDLELEAQQIIHDRLEGIEPGMSGRFDLWRESMPNSRYSTWEAYNLFVDSQFIERAAAEGAITVSSGGEEDVLGAEIPTPGPDDAGDSTDGGEGTSEGDEDDPTALKLVPGMWTPPPEAEAENYEEPSTFAMTQTDDWMKESKSLWEYSDKTGIKERDGQTPVEDPTDQQIANWARNELSFFNWNVVQTVAYAAKIMSSDDPQRALNFLNLINMYDHSDGGAREFGMALLGIGTDPTTYAGVGVGKLAAMGVAKTTAKAGLKKAAQVAIIGGTAGATEGGAIAGGFNLATQKVEQEAGAREDIDKSQVALSTGAGMLLGTAIGGGAGHLVGRRMDKLARMQQDEMSRILGGQRVEEQRIADEIAPDELIRMLENSIEESAKQGRRDEAAGVALKYLRSRDELPRNADGTLDVDQVARDMEAFRLDEARTARERRLADAPRREGRVEGRRVHDDPHITPRIVDETGQLDVSKMTGKLMAQTLDHIDRLERNTNWKLSASEDPFQILIEVTEHTPAADSQRIRRIAKESGVTVDTQAIPNAPGDQVDVAAYITIDGSPEQIGRFVDAIIDDLTPARLPGAESKAFAERIAEMDVAEGKDIVSKTASLPGSRVRGLDGAEYEVMGRTKNGWFHLMKKSTGEEVNLRASEFEVLDAHPAPEFAGPMELKPFTESAAKIIAMNEEVVSGKLKEVRTTHAEQAAMVQELREMGIDITEKKLATHWNPSELMFLRDTYNAQANGMHNLAQVLVRDLKNNGRLTDQQLAMFNEAHTQFVATRDLFFGTSGNAARQLNILQSRPKDDVYEFSQSLMDSISLNGGRINTERAITIMAETVGKRPGKSKTGAITSASDGIWGNQYSAALLNVRYNMMLSSWRTHFFNFLGNSASGVYQHLMVNPVKMGINNVSYAMDVAKGVINPKFTPDPADRLVLHSYWAGVRSHYSSARDSFALAKEIAMGREIGEGKVWNELGLRYNVINVPDKWYGKLGTTPVRLLEAGDAFFKNQYYMSKIHELASIKARADQIHRGMDFQTSYQKYVDDPDAPMQRAAKEYGQKQTYTNDPNVYGGILAAVARGVASAQNRNIAVNMIVPFVRTPANLLSYSMETIGANVLLSPSNTYNAIFKGTAQESQEALARLTVAAGLWLVVREMYENGNITGTGPSNWEERKVWEAAGWQANSIKIHGKWYDISRADPGGQSLATIASVYDFYAMTQQQDKPAMEWIGAGLLYTADMIIDESYLSTASDFITAVQSKEAGRVTSGTASIINSMVIPNILRDLRRPFDETKRSAASTNLLDQVQKQMMNASPWHSENLPPQRDWKGDPKNLYGNAYERGMIPFNVRDPQDSDPASMALAYARIPVSTPNRTIDWPGGQGDGIDLFAMDNGAGFVYDKYIEILGKHREYAVNIAMKTPAWKQVVKDDNIGPGSEGEFILRKALGIGSRNGRLEMLGFLVEHHGENNTFRRGNGDLIHIQHPVSVSEYIRLHFAVRNQGLDLSLEDFPQYNIRERREGPEFFKP